MRRKRRNHLPSFKTRVALAALKGDLTMAELSDKFEIPPNQITEWKRLLLENTEAKIKPLHAKIGQLNHAK